MRTFSGRKSRAALVLGVCLLGACLSASNDAALSLEEKGAGKKLKGPMLAGRLKVDRAFLESSEQVSPSAPDPALISVLGDMARALQNPKGLGKIDDAGGRTVLTLAGSILEKALSEKHSACNRIIAAAKHKAAAQPLSTEAWASGQVTVSNDLKGSLSAVWAKRANGLINVTIAGDTTQTTEKGRNIGQFVVVLMGRSSVQSGLDIQSQSDVDFWLGEVNRIIVESDLGASNCTLGSSLAKQLALKKNVSPVYEKSVSVEVKRDNNVILGTVDTGVSSYGSPKVADENKETRIDLDSNAQGEPGRVIVGQAPAPALGGKSSGEEGERLNPDSIETELRQSASPSGETHQKEAGGRINFVSEPVNAPSESSGQEVTKAVPARVSLNQLKFPVTLIVPERVIAGQPFTVSVIKTADKSAQPDINLEFNGTFLTTDQRGQAAFSIPEEAQPGKLFKVSMPTGSEQIFVPVEILQPLTAVDSKQAPCVDSVSEPVIQGGTVLINGHNFQGQALHDLVLIDNSVSPDLLASSPVQIKASIPADLALGKHTLTVSVDNAASNTVDFELVSK